MKCAVCALVAAAAAGMLAGGAAVVGYFYDDSEQGEDGQKIEMKKDDVLAEERFIEVSQVED